MGRHADGRTTRDDILRVLAHADDPMTVREIAEKVGRSMSTVGAHLGGLEFNNNWSGDRPSLATISGRTSRAKTWVITPDGRAIAAQRGLWPSEEGVTDAAT